MEAITANTASTEEPTVATAEAKTLSRTPSTIKIYTVTKGLKNKQTSVLSAEVVRNAPEEETREAESGSSSAKTATSEEVQNANAILASAVAISSGGREMPVTEIVVEQRDGVEGSARAIAKVLKDYGVPLPDDACWTTVNEETSKAWTTANDETAKAWTAVNDETAKAWKTVESSKAYNEMSNHLTKFNESASQVYSQAVDGLTTAYVKAEEELSLVGLAITQTQTVKSLNEFLATEKSAETNKENAAEQTAETPVEEKKEVEQDEDEAEYEGEGMEISLTNKIGDTKTLSEI